MSTDEFATLLNGDKVPRYLYRYLSIDENLFTSLRESYAWFTNPEIFNDPYDCNLRLNNLITDDTITAYLEVVNAHINTWDANKLKERIVYFKNHKDEFKDYLDNEFLAVAKTCGVCCFSERWDTLLMWSHYAQKHAGVCLKFDMKGDTSLFQQTSLVKVKYPNHYPQFDFMKYVIDNKGTPVGKELTEFVVGIKSTDWEYEKEIRLVRWKNFHGTFRDKIGLNKNALVGAYFGYRSKKETIETVLSAINECGYSLQEVKKGYLKHKDFGLSFKDY